MSTKKKMLQAAAGNAGGAGLNVEEVFSTYLYRGNGSTQTITNGIDLDGEGGLVWTKDRTYGTSHCLVDTERGTLNSLFSNLTDAANTGFNTITAFNSDGFTVGTSSLTAGVGDSAMASWTFRKAPKFFDVVTYTGTGSVRTVNHNLGSAPGFIIIKETSGTAGWYCYHRSLTATDTIVLNETGAASDSIQYWNNTEPTDSVFTVGAFSEANDNGQTYVAYLFAHNDGDGEFGPDGDADIIKCGSYSGNAPSSQDIDLGFEPQWILVKPIQAGGWHIYDNMRGWAGYGATAMLEPNFSNAENPEYSGLVINPTGFTATADTTYNNNTQDYIYIAIRRGTKVPESGTEVFDVDLVPDASGPTYTSSFPVDMATMFRRSGGDDWYTSDRLRGPVYVTFDTGIEFGFSSFASFDYSAGFSRWDNTDYSAWMWKRAPKFFDAVAYKGLGAYGSINHNLTVEPEMMWFKNRDDDAEWICWHKDFPSGNHLRLNEGTSFYTGVLPTNFSVSDTQINFGNTNAYQVNSTSWNYIAYLFASLPSVSKVGTYAGNGGSQTIDCGFTSGARFVLIKKYSGNGNVYIFDTRRGIVSGNDPYLQLNTQSAEDAFGGKDVLDPHSSGFIVNQTTLDTNASGEDYIFYAIA